MLSVTNLTFKRGSQTILDQVTYTFAPGTITCIVGPSGSGKSTLLACLTQLYTSYEGTIRSNDLVLSSLTAQERAQTIGIVFQTWHLFPLLTAQENISQPLMLIGGLSKEQAREKAAELLRTFDMQDYAHAYSSQLSGGQQQRIALARALGLKPKILCLDEPTSALDAGNSQLLIEELKQLKLTGITVIITSHDREFVASVADTVLELEEGKLKSTSLKN